MTSTTYPDSMGSADVVTRSYGVDGALAQMVDQRGVTHDYTYNARRQLVYDNVSSLGGSGVVDGTVRSLGRSYDAQGRLIAVTSYDVVSGGPSNAVNEIKYSYDSLGLVSASEQAHAGAVTTGTLAVGYAYGTATSGGAYANGLRETLQAYPDGAETEWQRNGSGSLDGTLNDDGIHDRFSRVSAITFKPSGGTEAAVATYAYNGASRVVEEDYVVPDVRRRMFFFGNNWYAGWDRFGRVTNSIWAIYSGTARDSFAYTYDDAGNRLSRDIAASLYASNNLDQVYLYDELHRLKNATGGTYNASTKVIDSRIFEQDWSLDQLGNWSTFKQRDTETGSVWDLQQLRTHNVANEINDDEDDADPPGDVISTLLYGSNWADPDYDSAGNMTAIPQPASPTSSYALKWDARNRMVEVQDGANTVQKNEYDGLHRRIVRKKYVSGTLNETRHFYYNQKWQVLEERVGTTGESARVDCQYVYHPYYVDALVLRYWDSNSSGGPDLAQYYLQDANFNVTAVVNASGAVVERYHYTPYGVATVLNGASDYKIQTRAEIGVRTPIKRAILETSFCIPAGAATRKPASSSIDFASTTSSWAGG